MLLLSFYREQTGYEMLQVYRRWFGCYIGCIHLDLLKMQRAGLVTIRVVPERGDGHTRVYKKARLF